MAPIIRPASYQPNGHSVGLVRVTPPSVSSHLSPPLSARDLSSYRRVAADGSPYVLVPRGATSLLMDRMSFANDLGLTFFDTTTGRYKRNLYNQLGYIDPLQLRFPQYMARYSRGGIAERIVEAYPKDTWSNAARVIEDPDPSTETTFERAVRLLFTRLKLWDRFRRVDILAGIGQYAALLIGARGALDSKLPDELRPEDVKFIRCYHEGDVTWETGDLDFGKTSERYGLPEMYKIRVRNRTGGVDQAKVHWSRIIHVVNEPLDNDVYGKPRLRAVWNYLDDLDKTVGGGAEAGWKRMDPGMQVNVDPEMPFSPAEQQALQDEMDEMQHGLRRYVRTRGTEVNLLSTTVAGFGPNAKAIVELISGTTGIPHRILTGSERGELASLQDRNNWNDRIDERRESFASPLVRDIISRFVEHGALPEPEVDVTTEEGKGAMPVNEGGDSYTVVWPQVGKLDNVAKAEIVGKLTGANQAQYIAGMEPVISSREIRRVFLGLPPLDPSEIPPSKAEVEAEKAKLAGELAAKKIAQNPGSGSGPEKDTPSPAGEGTDNQ